MKRQLEAGRKMGKIVKTLKEARVDAKKNNFYFPEQPRAVKEQNSTRVELHLEARLEASNQSPKQLNCIFYRTHATLAAYLLPNSPDCLVFMKI